MPASSFTELFNFEGNLNEAFNKWLNDNRLELNTSNDIEVLPEDFIGATVEVGSADPNHMQLVPNGLHEYDRYDLTLNFTITTQRTEEEGAADDDLWRRHQEIVANVRTWMAISNAKLSALNDTYLDLYALNTLVPDGVEYDHDETNDEDTTVLAFTGTFSILTDAWPVS